MNRAARRHLFAMLERHLRPLIFCTVPPAAEVSAALAEAFAIGLGRLPASTALVLPCAWSFELVAPSAPCVVGGKGRRRRKSARPARGSP